MSLLPYLIQDLIDDYRRPAFGDMFDQHFGLGLVHDDMLRPRQTVISAPLRCGYLRPWRNMAAGDSGVSSVESDKNEFRVNLDVQQFKPEELKVKVVDGFIVVDGKHEERSDQHGFISRQFTRRYKLPENVNQSDLVSHLSSDGVLTLKAPKLTSPEKEIREIPITQTNQPAVKSKSSVEGEAVKKEEKMEQ